MSSGNLYWVKLQNYSFVYNDNKAFSIFAGMSFHSAISIIQSQIGIIKNVQVLYSDTVRKILEWTRFEKLMKILIWILSEPNNKRITFTESSGS